MTFTCAGIGIGTVGDVGALWDLGSGNIFRSLVTRDTSGKEELYEVADDDDVADIEECVVDVEEVDTSLSLSPSRFRERMSNSSSVST